MLTQKLDLPYYLMLIIDLDSIKKTFSVPNDFIFNSIKSGVNMVQVRDTKTEYANKLSLINKIKTKFNNNCTVIVNSDYRLASESNADGIQIKASEWGNFNFSNLRPNLLIGKSTHLYDNHEINNIKKPNYVIFGTIFKSKSHLKTKPIGLNKFNSIKKKYQCPVIAIGGINVNNVSEVIKSGADGAAFITGILNSQNPYSTIKKIKSKLLK